MGACPSRQPNEMGEEARTMQAAWYQNVANYTAEKYNAATEYIGPKITQA